MLTLKCLWSTFKAIIFWFHHFFCCCCCCNFLHCFNQWEAGAADLRTSTSVPPFSRSVWKIHVIWPPRPPPLVLIRDECSWSSVSRGLSPPLTTVRPNSTLITLTPRHIPVQSLRNLCCGDLAGELREKTEREESYFSPGVLNTQLQVW